MTGPMPEREWRYGDPCQCGCGGQPKGKRSRFLPGHDARLHSPVRTPATEKPLPQPQAHWQHRTPQEAGHVVKPKATNARVCATCGKPIKRVGANEGPETLKALFRF